MWDLPDSGIDPVSPQLAGRLFNIESPGEPLRLCPWCLRIPLYFILSGRGKFSTSTHLVVRLIMKLIQDRLTGEKKSLISVPKVLMEIRPKWPKEATFIFLRQRNNKFERN